MNLLATASELQVKGLSQIQETRSQSGSQPPAPELKATRQPSLSEANRIKPVPAAPEGKSGKQLTLVQEVSKVRTEQHNQQLQNSSSNSVVLSPSLKRKHDQLSTAASNSSHHYTVHQSSNANHSPGDRISFLKGSSSLQEDCEERLRPSKIIDLKKETVDPSNTVGTGTRSERDSLATLHKESSPSKQVPVSAF
jgi:hypothetical protein